MSINDIGLPDYFKFQAVSKNQKKTIIIKVATLI